MDQEIHNLDDVFEALAHKHRREIIEILSLQPCSISQLAAQRNLSLPAIHKHIYILEKGGLIVRKKIGQSNYLSLSKKGLRGLQDWLMRFQTHWGNDQETLENYNNYLTKDSNTKEKT